MHAIQPASSSVTCTSPYLWKLRKDKLRNTSFRSILQFSVLGVAKLMLKVSDICFYGRPDTCGWDSVLLLTNPSDVYEATFVLHTVHVPMTPDTHVLLCQVLWWTMRQSTAVNVAFVLLVFGYQVGLMQWCHCWLHFRVLCHCERSLALHRTCGHRVVTLRPGTHYPHVT
jgi:hypothetical protein